MLGLKAPHNSYNAQDLIYFNAFNISLLITVCNTQKLDTGQATVLSKVFFFNSGDKIQQFDKQIILSAPTN